MTLVPAAVPPSAPTESASPIHIALPPYRSRGVVFSSVSYGSTSVLLVYSTLDSISRSGFLRISFVGVVHVLPALWFGLSGTVRVHALTNSSAHRMQRDTRRFVAARPRCSPGQMSLVWFVSRRPFSAGCEPLHVARARLCDVCHPARSPALVRPLARLLMPGSHILLLT